MTSAYFGYRDDPPRLPPASSIPPHHPPVTLPSRAAARVDMTGRWPRLIVVWQAHPPAATMRAVQHQLAALVWSRSEGRDWDVRLVDGAVRGNLPCVGVELVLDRETRHAHREAEDLLLDLQHELDSRSGGQE